jgi:hypothetical protein
MKLDVRRAFVEDRRSVTGGACGNNRGDACFAHVCVASGSDEGGSGKRTNLPGLAREPEQRGGANYNGDDNEVSIGGR